MKFGQSIRSVAKREGMSRATVKKMLKSVGPIGYGASESIPCPPKPRASRDYLQSPATGQKQRWLDMLYALERGDLTTDPLARLLPSLGTMDRRRVLAVMACERGLSASATAAHMSMSKNTVKSELAKFRERGADEFLRRVQRSSMVDDETLRNAVFSLLHEPPSLYGFNRTTWKMDDLRDALARKGHHAGRDVLRRIIMGAGFRWRQAKVVLTSTDPKYREKLAHIQDVLEHLGSDERFFSIDEFGPFAIKAKAGRCLVGPDESPSVPQWQKSKGWLIATAALELSRNQVTHFYSRAKNTAEMIKMVKQLLDQSRDVRTLYISWAAASWHMSKALLSYVDEHNSMRQDSPRVELVPLPSSAQFLNVIESVFSGMARAIIHSSDYPSVEAARLAIDRYFSDRNRVARPGAARAAFNSLHPAP